MKRGSTSIRAKNLCSVVVPNYLLIVFLFYLLVASELFWQLARTIILSPLKIFELEVHAPSIPQESQFLSWVLDNS